MSLASNCKAFSRVSTVQDVDGDGKKDRFEEHLATCPDIDPEIEECKGCPTVPPDRLILSSGKDPSEVPVRNSRGQVIRIGDPVLGTGDPFVQGVVDGFSADIATSICDQHGRRSQTVGFWASIRDGNFLGGPANGLIPLTDENKQALINDEDPKVAAFAVKWFAEKGKMSTQELIDCIDNPHSEVAVYAVKRLAETGKLNREELMDIAGNNKLHDDVRIAAAQALNTAGTE